MHHVSKTNENVIGTDGNIDHSSRAIKLEVVDIFDVVWNGWKVILSTIFVSILLATIYTSLAEELWSSKANIVPPQLDSLKEFQAQVYSFEPLFEISPKSSFNEGNSKGNDTLENLVDENYLFELFLQQFTSSVNKKEFIDSSDLLGKYLQQYIEISGEESLQGFYNQWYKRISVNTPKPGTKREGAELRFQAYSPQDSYFLLKDYVEFIIEKVKFIAINDLKSKVLFKKLSLENQKSLLNSQALASLNMEIEKAKLELFIAENAAVKRPASYISEGQELLSIKLGSEAIRAKIKALQGIENVSIIEPRISDVASKISLLNSIEIKDDIKFLPFLFTNEIEMMTVKDHPAKLLILFLSSILGAVFGVIVVLVNKLIIRHK